MRTYDYQIMTAGDLSTATLDSNVPNVDFMLGCAIQCIFIGNATGNLTLQGSCDPITDQQLQAGTTVTNWTDITTSALAAPGTVMFNVSDIGYKWLRIHYAKTGGTGSITINVHAKGF